MKRISIIMITLLLSGMAMMAQEENRQDEKRQKRNSDSEMQTIFGKQRSNGGYGAFWMGYSMIDDRHALQFGGRGSWIIQHTFAIGFGGTGFINEYHYDASLDRQVFLTGGYGGMYLEPILFPKSPVHLAFPTLIGVGGISFVSYDDVNWDSNFVEYYDAFLIIEPGAEVELNLTRFMRLGIGATYRLPYDFNIGQAGSGMVSSESIRGLTYNVTFKFGSF